MGETLTKEQVAERHAMAMHAIGFAYQILEPNLDALHRLVNAEKQMHSIMHITDPTMYFKAINSDNLRHQVDLAKVALAFISATSKIKDELPPEPQWRD
jgi:hypothetical protein